MNRPTGVTIIAILELVCSFMSMLGALGAYTVKKAYENGSLHLPSTQQFSPEKLQTGFQIFYVSILFSVLIELLMAYGLFNLKKWAWFLTLICTIFSFLINIVYLVSKQPNSGYIVLILVINTVIIYYLLQPRIMRAFRLTSSSVNY